MDKAKEVLIGGLTEFSDPIVTYVGELIVSLQQKDEL